MNYFVPFVCYTHVIIHFVKCALSDTIVVVPFYVLMMFYSQYILYISLYAIQSLPFMHLCYMCILRVFVKCSYLPVLFFVIIMLSYITILFICAAMPLQRSFLFYFYMCLAQYVSVHYVSACVLAVGLNVLVHCIMVLILLHLLCAFSLCFGFCIIFYTDYYICNVLFCFVYSLDSWCCLHILILTSLQ